MNNRNANKMSLGMIILRVVQNNSVVFYYWVSNKEK